MRLLSLSLLAGLASILLAFSATPALAATAHSYAGQFGSAGSGGGQFAGGGPNAVAVRQSTGEVFVLDPMRTDSEGAYAPRIERFDAAGNFQSAFGTDATVQILPTALAIDPAGSASIYLGGLDNATQTTGSVLKYTAAGVFAYALSTAGSETTLGYPVALAVDPADGTVYVNAVSESTGLPAIDVFDDTGAFVASFDGSTGSPDGGFGSISALAVDSSHRLYASDSAKSRVDRYDASGVWQATVDDGSRGAPSAIAADPTSGEVDVLEAGPLGQQVTRFSAGGAAALESFGASHIGAAGAIAVAHSSGTVYTADAAIAAVERFTTFIAPTVTTEASSALSASEATLNGTIDPEGVAGTTSYRFDWGADGGYGSSTPETDTGGGSSNLPATATIAGLAPGTTYHYRLVGTNPSGSSFGADETLTTAAAAPAVDTQGPPVASAIASEGATFDDVVNPNGAETTYRYEYGTDTSYGASTTDADAGSATGEVGAPATVAGLQPGTTYHFRIVAENGVGAPVDGADATFTTAPGTAASATAITATSATLHATVIPGTSGAGYRFEYGTDSSYGTSTPEQSAPAGTEEVPVSSPTLPLLPGTTYHFRVVARINGQTVSGNDATFTTIPAATVTTAAVTEVTPTTATLNASVDTHGVAGTIAFSVTSLDSPYGTTTASTALSATAGSQPVSVPLTGLPPGGEYVVRASATVAGTTAWGEQAIFSTPGLPPFNPPAPAPGISGAPYGCAAPHIDPVNTHPKPGDTVTLTGSDLGVGGTIALGSAQLQPSSWSGSAIGFQVPEGASGTQPLSIDCGVLSNTVGLAISPAPSSAFSIAKVTVKGASATFVVKLPGPGKLQLSSGRTAATSKTVASASTAQLSIHLSQAAKKALAKAKSRKLAVSARLTFTPVGGTAASQTRSITFKRGGSR